MNNLSHNAIQNSWTEHWGCHPIPDIMTLSHFIRTSSLRIPHSGSHPELGGHRIVWTVKNREGVGGAPYEEDCIWDMRNTSSDHQIKLPTQKPRHWHQPPSMLHPSLHSAFSFPAEWFWVSPAPLHPCGSISFSLDHCPRLLPCPLLWSHSTLTSRGNFLKYAQGLQSSGTGFKFKELCGVGPPLPNWQCTENCLQWVHEIHPRLRCSAQLRLTLCNPWTVACQVPLSMGFFRQEYWSGLPFPSPGDLLYPGIEPASPVAPALQAASLPAKPSGKYTKGLKVYLRNVVITGWDTVFLLLIWFVVILLYLVHHQLTPF